MKSPRHTNLAGYLMAIGIAATALCRMLTGQ